MKKLCLLLAVFLLLTGCAQAPETVDCSVSHVDKNDDGLCDSCQAVVLVTFDVVGINDLHGKLADSDDHPGVDELSTYIKQTRQVNENVILLSSGDMWQGAAESNMTNGLIITDWMNQMEFTSMTLGNHEYDWGEDAIKKNAELAEFPLLGINVYSRQTGEQAQYCQSSVVVEKSGVKIGIIGAMGDCYSSIASEQSKDIFFKTGSELTQLVMAESQRLRQEGVDFIIYSIHDGYEDSTSGKNATKVSSRELSGYYDTKLSDGYVDLVFEAHTHQRYLLQDEHGVYHLQGGGDNKGITQASILLNQANGNYSVMSPELLSTGEYALLEDDPVVSQLLEKYDEQVAPAMKVVGNNGVHRNSDELRQLVAKLYLDAGLEKWGKEYDIVLGGGFISCRSPGYMSSGEVKYGLLQSLFPFDNEITLCSIKGRELLSKFLETDHYAYFIEVSDYGDRIKNSIDPDATYYVITDSFSAYYAPNKMTVLDVYAPEVYARDLLADYMTAGGLE